MRRDLFPRCKNLVGEWETVVCVRMDFPLLFRARTRNKSGACFSLFLFFRGENIGESRVRGANLFRKADTFAGMVQCY